MITAHDRRMGFGFPLRNKQFDFQLLKNPNLFVQIL